MKDDGPAYYSIPGILEKIYDKLSGGVAFVAIQKNPGNPDGDGGHKTRHKANAYVTLDQSRSTNIHWLNIQISKVKPDSEGAMRQYAPNPFSLRARSDWLSP